MEESKAEKEHEALQRHHDIYVQKFYNETLGTEEGDWRNYATAVHHEIEGKVVPLN